MHELTDRRADGGDGFVVGDELLVKARFELVEVLGQFLVGSEKRTQLHERAHDVYGHLYGALAAEYIGGLDGAVLGEGEGLVTSAAATVSGWRF